MDEITYEMHLEMIIKANAARDKKRAAYWKKYWDDEHKLICAKYPPNKAVAADRTDSAN